MSALSKFLSIGKNYTWAKALVAAFISGIGSGLSAAVAVPGATIRSIFLASLIPGIIGIGFISQKKPNARFSR